MAHFAEVAERVFPGRMLSSLSPEECRVLVSHMERYTENLRNVASIYEIVEGIFKWVDTVEGERVRQVCKMWNEIVVGRRSLNRFKHIMDYKDGLHHIAIQLEYAPYVRYARTQEEFDTLWTWRESVKFRVIPQEYVRPVYAEEAFSKICDRSYLSGAVEWALELNWESLQMIKLVGAYRDWRSILGAIPCYNPIDPRKIVWLRDNSDDFKKIVEMAECRDNGICDEVAAYARLYMYNLGGGEWAAQSYGRVYECQLISPLPKPTAEGYAEVYRRMARR